MKKKPCFVFILVLIATAASSQSTPAAPAKPAIPAQQRMMDRQPTPPAPPVPAIAPLPPGLPRIPMAWWKDSKITKGLNLTEQQLARLEQTFTENRLKLIDLRANLEKEEVRLQPLVEADRFDENQISAQLDAVIAARGRLEKTSAMMSFEMRKVLTQEQWKKLQTLQTGMRAPRAIRLEGPGIGVKAPNGMMTMPVPPNELYFQERIDPPMPEPN